MADKETTFKDKTVGILEDLIKYSTYIFIFYVLTDIRKGGDFRYVIPYLTFALIVTSVVVNKDYSVFRSHLFYALSAYVLISYLLLPFSFAPYVSIESLNREILSGYFIFLAVRSRTDSNRKTESSLIFFAVLLAFIVICGYYSFFYRYVTEGKFTYMRPDLELIKFYLYHNSFAMVINVLLSFVIAYAVLQKDKSRRLLIVLLIVLSAFAVIFSLSRGGWVSLIITAVLWGMFFRIDIKKSFIPLVAGVVIITAGLWFLAPTVHKRIVKTSQHISTFNERTDIWMNKVSAIQRSPLVGWGFGDNIAWDGSPLILNELNRESLPKAVKIGSHNTFLHVLFHQGIIGLIFFMYFIVAGFVMILKEFRRKGYGFPTLYAVICVFISVFIIHSFIETVPFQYICIVLGFFSGLTETVRMEYS